MVIGNKTVAELVMYLGILCEAFGQDGAMGRDWSSLYSTVSESNRDSTEMLSAYLTHTRVCHKIFRATHLAL